MPIVQQRRASETRRFGEAHVTRYTGTKYLAIEMLDELHRHLVRKVDARIEHRPQDAEDLECRVDRVAHLLDRVQQRRQPFERVVLALHRDQHAVCRGQGIHGQHVDRGRAVYEDEIVQPRDGRQRFLQLQLAPDFLQQLYLGERQVFIARQHGKAAFRRGDDRVRGRCLTQEHVAGGVLELHLVDAASHGRIALGVHVDHQHATPRRRE